MDPFYYMGDEAGATRELVPTAAETQVLDLIQAFEVETAKPFAPTVGAHGLVFGEWGHGKTQVLYRVRQRLEVHPNRCVPLMVMPEAMSPRFLVQAAAFEAETRGLPFEELRQAAIDLTGVDAQESRAAVRAAEAFADFATATHRPHVALLFDEAQTLSGVSFQELLRHLQEAVLRRGIALHTLQCHSLVTLDRALQLAQELAWLKGPNVRKVHLPSLREDEAHSLFSSRLSRTFPERAESFIDHGLARTICRLMGGNPREMLKLAGELWVEVGTHARATGNDLVKVCERWETGAPGQTLFMRSRLTRLTDLLPQVWQADVGASMASYLQTHVGQLFGEDATIEMAIFAGDLGANVDVIEKNLRRPVDGVRLLDVAEDEFGSVVRLSVELRRYISSSFTHGGDFDEKQAQFDTLIAPTSQQRDLADALRFTELGQVSTVRLGFYPDESLIRGYELTYQVPDTSFSGKVLLTAMPGVRWPTEIGAELVRTLSSGGWVRAIVIDLVVTDSWQAWVDECASANVRLPVTSEPRIVVPIGPDAWGSILQAPVEGADSPGVRAAVLCGALRGADHSRRNQIEFTQTQSEARQGLVALVRDLLPRAEAYCYLPTDEERAWLDLPLWSSGALSLATLRDHLNRPGLAGAQLRNLLPHYLESESGRKWTRRPFEKQPLARAILEVLKKSPEMAITKLQESIRSKLVLPHAERLPSCFDWMLDKLTGTGFVTRDLINVQYRDVGRDVRETGIALRRKKTALDVSLQRLKSVSEEEWQEVRVNAAGSMDEAKAAVAEREGNAQTILVRIQNADQQLHQVAASVQARLQKAEQKLKALESDVSGWTSLCRPRVEKVHADWRELWVCRQH